MESNLTRLESSHLMKDRGLMLSSTCSTMAPCPRDSIRYTILLRTVWRLTRARYLFSHYTVMNNIIFACVMYLYTCQFVILKLKCLHVHMYYKDNSCLYYNINRMVQESCLNIITPHYDWTFHTWVTVRQRKCQILTKSPLVQ